MRFTKQRFEAFSDGVIAIIITIMVLSIPLPKKYDFQALLELMGSIFVYFLSFVVVGAFWSQHQRICSYVDEITRRLTVLNLLFLFFLSLVPIFTKWVIENPGYIMPAIFYVVVYLFTNVTQGFIFDYVVNNRENDHFNNIKLQRIQEKKTVFVPWSRIGFTTIVIVLSIFLPQISTILLLGLPVSSAVKNLIIDGYDVGKYKRNVSGTFVKIENKNL